MARSGKSQVIAIGDVVRGRAVVQLYGITISVPAGQVAIYQQHKGEGTLAPYRTVWGKRDGVKFGVAG